MVFLLGSSGCGKCSCVLATSYASGGKYDIVGEEQGYILCATILAQNFTMSKRRVIEHAAKKYLSPTLDVEEFCMVVLEWSQKPWLLLERSILLQ